VAFENDAEEVEDFALLEIAGTPDGRERRQRHGVGAIGGAQADHDRAVLQRHRVEMIDGFEVAGLDADGLLLDNFGAGRRRGQGTVDLTVSVISLAG